MKILRCTLKLFLMGFFAILSLVASLYLFASLNTPIELKTNNLYTFYDNDNQLVFQGNEKNEWVDLEDISPYLINAIISIEDKNFNDHHGFDYLRIGKTFYNNFINKRITGGASTISQQLVKNMYLDFGKTWKRKIKEAFLTINLETHYNKDEILSAYLNTVNFGQGNYGIQNASKYYFNVDAKDLTLEQSLILAGIPKNPNNYNPVNNYDMAINRAMIVKQAMLNNNYISEDESVNLFKNKLIINKNNAIKNSNTILYFQDAVINELKNIDTIPANLIESGGLKIYTTIDLDAQYNMEENINKEMINSNMQVGSILIDPNNGEVKALIGGKDYNKSQYNRVINAKRQVGSTMKPLLYYCALENGMVSSSTFLSEPTTFTFANNKTYAPKNFNDKYGNKNITMAAALSYSDNIYAVKTHLFLGEDTLVKYGKKIGLTTKLEPIPSLALGTIELSMLEFAQAYNSLASGGYNNKIHFIRKIEDIYGNLLYEYKNVPELINNPNNIYILNELLTSTYNSAFKDYNNPTVISIASKVKNRYAVKTGTTDTDFWIVGYNKDALMLTWNGYDDNSFIDNKDYQISRNIWLNTIETYLKEKENSWYQIPHNVVGIQKNAITGSKEYDNHNANIFYYVKGTQ